LAPEPVAITGNTATIDFQWDPPSAATLTLNVVDADGMPVPGARVRVTSHQAPKVGTLTVQNAGGAPTTEDAYANVQVEGTTSPSGAVAFPNLPASSNASYDLLIVPATLSARATTTTVLALPVPSGGSIQTVQLQAQIGINGQLLAPNSLPAPLDFSSVTIRTYDQSADSPESQTATAVRTDGSFSVFVTPGRSYVLLAVPPTDSGAARTFVGPGPMQASEFTVTQKLMASIMWKGTVRTSDPRNSSLPKIPIPGTVLQIRCLGGPKAWPYCFDGTAALAETTSDANGAFQFALADPSTR